MDTIAGGSIDHDGVVKMTIDSGKVGYIILPNKTVLTTVAGVINTTNTGVAGNITYYFPTDEDVDIQNSGVSGKLIHNGTGTVVVSTCVGVTSLTSLLSENVVVSTNPSMTELIAPIANVVQGDGCALTAKSIGDILYLATPRDVYNQVYIFSGGTNATDTAIDSYLTATYGTALASLLAVIVYAKQGAITLNS